MRRPTKSSTQIPCAVDGVYALRRSLSLQWSLETVFRDRFLSEARSRLPNEVVAELEEAKQVRLAKSLDERARVPAQESPEVGGATVDRISNLQRLNSRISGPVSHRGGWPRTGTTRRALVVVAVDELVELGLLLEEVLGGGLGGFL